MRKTLFAIFFIPALLCAQLVLAAEFLRGSYCYPAPLGDAGIAMEESILDKKASDNTKDHENVKNNEENAPLSPKYICTAFQDEVTIEDIYVRGWRVVGILQTDAVQDMREYSARRGLFSGEVRHREQMGIRANHLIIEEQSKGTR